MYVRHLFDSIGYGELDALDTLEPHHYKMVLRGTADAPWWEISFMGGNESILIADTLRRNNRELTLPISLRPRIMGFTPTPPHPTNFVGVPPSLPSSVNNEERK